MAKGEEGLSELKCVARHCGIAQKETHALSPKDNCVARIGYYHRTVAGRGDSGPVVNATAYGLISSDVEALQRKNDELCVAKAHRAWIQVA